MYSFIMTTSSVQHENRKTLIKDFLRVLTDEITGMNDTSFANRDIDVSLNLRSRDKNGNDPGLQAWILGQGPGTRSWYRIPGESK